MRSAQCEVTARLLTNFDSAITCVRSPLQPQTKLLPLRMQKCDHPLTGPEGDSVRKCSHVSALCQRSCRPGRQDLRQGEPARKGNGKTGEGAGTCMDVGVRRVMKDRRGMSADCGSVRAKHGKKGRTREILPGLPKQQQRQRDALSGFHEAPHGHV